MVRINLQKGKHCLSPLIWILCAIWMLAVCMIAFVFYKKTTPIYTQEALNSALPLKTPALACGESVSQSFRSSYNYLYSVGVAVSYQDDMPEETSLLVQILAGEELIVEQNLSVRYFPNSGFCTFLTDLRDCQGKVITIRIKNTSQGSENAVFSLLATDKSYLYTDNSDNYLLNNDEQTARLLFVSSYVTGYSYYRALTYAFWIFLSALIVSDLVTGHASQLNYSR